MDWISGFIVLLSAAAIVGQLWGIFKTVKRIDLPGRVTGTAGAWVALTMMGVIGLTRFNDVAQNPLIYATIVALLVTFLNVKAGLGEDGAYHNGRLLPWREIEYFNIIRETQNVVSLRLHMRNTRDYVILFKPRYRDAVIDRLRRSGVKDWDDFEFPSDR